MKRRDRQNGFLIIVAILVVVIIAFIAVTATYQYSGDRLSSYNHLRSAQAFHIAQSGIEQGKHDVVNGTSCSGYNSGTVNFTAPSGSGSGQYQVTGSINSASSKLNGNITNSATSIVVTNASGFTNGQGAFQIDSEIISYTGKSGNTLTGAIRGVNGTSAVAHTSGAIVQQNECFLTSTAGIPTIGSPTGKRILKALIIGTSFGFNIGGNFVIPAAAGSGNFDLQGNPTVANTSVTLNGPGYPGANILISGTLNTTGNSWQTTVAGGTTSSGGNTIKPDIQTSTGLFNASTLFSQYFNQTSTQMRTAAIANGTFHAAGSNINGLTGQVIWYDGNLGSVNLGTAASPVLLIVNGNLSLKGNDSITGFIFVLGTSASAGGTPDIIGAIAGIGDISLKGNPTVTLDQNVLTLVNQISGGTNVKYSNNAVILQESFQ
jgi:Tfp pilus assembly protein PilX